MRLFFINALLLLATTSTLAIPVALVGEKGSISLYKHAPGAGDKHAITSSIPTTHHHPADAGSDHASLVRRTPVRQDGRPSTSILKPKKSSIRKPRKNKPKSKQWTHKKKKSGGGGGGGGGEGGGGAAGEGIAAGA